MKRFIMAALLVVAGLGMASNALAQTYGGSPHLVSEQLPWRQAKVNTALGYIDSLAFNRIGVGGATMPAANAETTVAIPTRGWAVPFSGITTVGDSCTIFNVIFSDAGATNANVDSIHVAIQVSSDNLNWVYVGQVLSQVGINPILAASPAVSSFALANIAGTTTTTPKVFAWRAPGTGLSSGILPDKFSLMRWPLIRFIVVNKTVGSYQHNLQCVVQHWSVLAN